MTSILRQSYWDYLTTKTSKTNGFDTIEIDLVLLFDKGGFSFRTNLHSGRAVGQMWLHIITLQLQSNAMQFYNWIIEVM